MNDEAPVEPLTQLRRVMHRLRAPGGCPWDAEQSHESLLPHLIEEAYEVAEAARSGDKAHLCEELGDLLLQPFFHAEIASETGAFTIDDVARGITEKLIRRHPHVFGDAKAETSDAVLTQWDAIKIAEKGGGKEPLLHGISMGLPALIRAQKLQKKAAKVGFDWPDATPVLEKVREEADEIAQAVHEADKAQIQEEIGDLLFTVVNLARKLGVEAEVALSQANKKFTSRFNAVEERFAAEGREMSKATLEEMDAVWDDVKEKSKRQDSNSKEGSNPKEPLVPDA
jgi:MazG family protein